MFVEDIVKSFATLVIPTFVPCFNLTFCTAPVLSISCKVFSVESDPSTALKLYVVLVSTTLLVIVSLCVPATSVIAVVIPVPPATCKVLFGKIVT